MQGGIMEKFHTYSSLSQKLMNKAVRLAVRLFLCLTLAVCFTACQGGSARPESNGEGILGRNTIASAENAGVAVDYETRGENHFLVNFFTVVFDGVKNNPATGYAIGYTAQWTQIIQSAGPPARYSCTVAANLLSMACEIFTTGPAPTVYDTALALVAASGTTTFKAQATLPFTAEVIGFVPTGASWVSRSIASSGSSSARAAVAEPGDDEAFGIKTEMLSRKKLPFNLVHSHVVDGSIFLGEPSQLYRYDTKDKSFSGYALIPPSSPVTQPGEPLVRKNSSRLRMSYETSFVAPGPEDTLLAHVQDSDAERILRYPRVGPPQVLYTIPKNEYGQWVTWDTGNKIGLFLLPNGDVFLVGPYRIYRISAAGPSVVAGNPSSQMRPGYVEDESSTSLAMHLYDIALFPNGDLIGVDNQNQRVLIFRTQTLKYETVLRNADRNPPEQCWVTSGLVGGASVAVGNTGLTFILAKGCTKTTLYRLGDVGLQIVAESSKSLHADEAHPETDLKMSLDQYPLHAEGLAVGGVNWLGPILVSGKGVAQVHLLEGKVETLLTLQPAVPNGAYGETAESTVLGVIADMFYGPSGELIAISGKSILTMKDNRINSAPLTGAPLTEGFFNLAVARDGARFILARGSAITPKLYRVNEVGEMTYVMDIPSSQSAMAIAAVSADKVVVNRNGRLVLFDLTLGTETELLVLPPEFSTIQPSSMSYGPDGYVYISRPSAIGRFPLDRSAPAIEVLMGGTQEAVDGMPAIQARFPTAGRKKISASEVGAFASDEFRLFLIDRAGLYRRIFPVSDSPNPDCAINMSGRTSRQSGQQINTVLDSMCKGHITATAVRVINGVAQIAIARLFGMYGSVLVIGMPLN